MNHRPYCLAGALAVLTWGLVCGNPFRCVAGVGAAAPSDRPRADEVSTPLVVTPAVAPAGTNVPVPAVFGGEDAADDLPDPDEVGPCPEPGLSPVVRRGRDADGLETWWHVDGSLTKRSTHRVDGEMVPVTVRVLPPRPLGEPEDEPPK